VNNNRLLIALIVLALLAGAVVSTLRSREPEATLAKPAASLPQLTQEEITKVELENPEKKLKLTLVKQPAPKSAAPAADADAGAEPAKPEANWRVTAPLDAQADNAAVESLVEKLAGLEIAAIAATKKENHEKVGVDSAHGIRVKAYNGDKLLLDAYVGASKTSGTMVRKEGEDTVFAVKNSIRYAFDKELKAFRDRVITDLNPDDVKSMVLTSPKGTFKFERPEANWQQAKGEKPIKDYSANKVQSLASSFARLRASDFAEPGATPASTGLDAPAAKLVLTPKSGEPVTFELGKAAEGGADSFLRASGRDVIYRVSKFTSDKLVVDATAFSEPPKKPGEEPPPSAHGMPVAGGGNLPPEILKQLQQQMGHPH
jgi:Domain of unknown function (DUF4340)